MSKESYEAKQASIETIGDDVVLTPDKPVAIALQEAEDQYVWCQKDKDALVSAGLDWTLVEDLQARASACRYIQSEWQKDYKSLEEAQLEWKAKSPEAYALRDELLHHFFHAYRNQSDLKSKVQKIADGDGNADMIQDLSDISVLGKANPEPLQQIGLDLNLLDNAATMADAMSELLARSNGFKMSDNKLKVQRDKAYTYLKMALDEIRCHGQYVFWRNEDRKKGYVSKYYRQRPASSKEKAEEKSEVKA
jgi:hypothetical protein